MNGLPAWLRRWSTPDPFPGAVLLVGLATALGALGLYAYLGTFSRYASDDYCLSAFFLTGDLPGAMVERYFVSSSRYTNILFIGLADSVFGWYNVAILPALMLSLFVWGAYLFLREIAGALQLGWRRSLTLYLSVLLVYFAVTQAPDLYETLYWRAGMTSHFAPVALMPFWGAFLLRRIRTAREGAPPLRAQAACFLIPFVIGGLSEPPTALMITVLGLALVAAWWGGARDRRPVLILLAWSLAGAIAALLVMGLAPANALRMQTPPPPLPEMISRIFSYPALFIAETLRTLPTPTLLSVAIPAVLFYVQYSSPPQDEPRATPMRLGLLMLLVLILAYLLIAASFAPSVYGQSYPVPRARFSARVVMTAALMADGALLGALLAHVRLRASEPARGRQIAILVLAVLVLYPLRTAWRAAGELPVYRQRAAVWDAREAEIIAMKNQGERDLVVRFLSEAPIQDLGDRTGFRLNRCAAALYGVDSIVAVPMESE